MTELLSSKLQLSTFTELRHNIIIKNNTSGTEIVDPKMISLVELGEKCITLSLPANSCAQGHVLSVFVYSHPLKRKLTKTPTEPRAGQIILTGRVLESYLTTDGEGQIVINISESSDEWTDIIKLYELHQKRINKLFAS